MAKDPYRFFRVEARELLDGLTRVLLAAERDPADPRPPAELLRLAHTLKGAARVVKQPEIARAAHELEEVAASRRAAGTSLDRDAIQSMLDLVDECTRRLAELPPAPADSSRETPRTAARPPVVTPEPTATLDDARDLPERSGAASTSAAPAAPRLDPLHAALKIEAADLDELAFELADAGVRLEAVERPIASLEELVETLARLANDERIAGDARSRLDELRREFRRVERELEHRLDHARGGLAAAAERVAELRLVPAATLFPALERVVRDAARTLDKRVAFEARGGDEGLDSHVLAAVRDALVQGARNSVAHGIETPAERIAVGKGIDGRIELRVERRGARLAFVLTDDGRGLDLPALRQAALERGAIDPREAESLSPERIARLAFAAGVSTRPEVSELAGRGVGLDVVRAAIDRVRGEISLRHEPGSGVALEIVVPTSIHSAPTLAVHAGGRDVLIPLAGIERTIRVTPDALSREGGREILSHGDSRWPFARLADLLAGRSHAPAIDAERCAVAVVLRADGREASVGVDRIEGLRTPVVRPLPSLCGRVPLVAGATLDAEGAPCLVLDPAALVAGVIAAEARPAD